LDTISINGRFLAQPLTGVQRFARELTRALDKRITAGTVPDALKAVKWRLIVPRNTPVALDLDLRSIQIESFGAGQSHIWEQTALAYKARHDLLVGFGGSGPLLHSKRQLAVIHDAMIFRHPETYSAAYRLFHSTLGFILARRAQLATVSAFSRTELSAVFGVPESNIAIISNAPDHFAALTPDPTILRRLGLSGGNFFLMAGTLKPSKNIQFALEAFKAWAGDKQLVVVGDKSASIFKTAGASQGKNIIFSGRLTDPEIAALERQASAFIFPSLYEGFGLPPLEAMTQGCPVLAAGIPAVREACGSAPLYFSPYKQDELIQAIDRVSADEGLRQKLSGNGRENVKRFSWDESASQLLRIVASL